MGNGMGRRPGRATFVAVAVAGVLLALGVGSAAPVHAPGGAGAARLVEAVGPVPFSVRGNEILEPNGTPYVEYGFVLWCLATPNLSCYTGPDSDSQKIVAAARFWHANTIRLQVAWEHLFNPDGSVDTAYVGMVDREVDLIDSNHMVAIITEQTERYGGSLMPDSNSLRFWRFMADHYRSNPMVFFDLFNEPRLPGTTTTVWKIWRDGGTFSSPSGPVTYVGMQELVGTIRGQGASNVVIAEGIQKDHDLAGLPAFALAGTNIAYGVEPSLRRTGPVKDASSPEWQSNWGTLSERYPIMMEAFLDSPQSDACNPTSPTLFPDLLSYLQANHLGLLFFTLGSGTAIVGDDLEEPTTFNGAGSLNCSAQLTTNTVGPGQELLDWFRGESRPIG
jgi:Cellulase (glycosyl hydrolase family 5)